MLPATIADFAGRLDHLGAIRRAVEATDGGDSRLAVPVVIISGRAGVGKTILAVHAAHGLVDRFPDGQLFANVHAATAHPVRPAQILQRFLRMLGVHGALIPDGVDERAEMFRNLLADRRVLIVLDDVDGEDSVVPLIPGGRSCAVMLTCRRRLPGLAGATGVGLGRFDPGQSLELLSRIIGSDRVRQEADHTRSLADLCGHLPLALRIAGARLAARPHWSIRQMSDRLADEERRLDELIHGGMAVRAGVRLIHDALSPPARRLFRLLATVDAHVFASWTAAALLDRPLDEAQDCLDELVDAHLVETVGTGRGLHSHYRFHDLIRGFARQRLAADEPAAQRSAALARALDAVLCLSRAAAAPDAHDPMQLSDRSPTWSPPAELVDEVTADPNLWFEREHVLITAAVHQAARIRLPDLCWALAIAIRQFLILRAYKDDALAVLTAALHAARQAADRKREAAVLLELGTHASGLRSHDDAERHLAAAEIILQQLHDERGVAVAIRGRAFVYYGQGRTAEAVPLLRRALATTRSLRFDSETAYILQVLAGISLLHDDVPVADRLLAEAIHHARASGNPRIVAQALHRTGQAQLQAGEVGLAADTLAEALALARGAGDVAGEAHILTGLGSTRLREGSSAAAHDVLSQARDLARTAHDALAEAHALCGLGEVALDQDRAEQSVMLLQQAVALFRAVGSRIHAAHALARLGDALQAAGHIEAARESWDEAMLLTEHMDPAVSAGLRAKIPAPPRGLP
ncbi:NB-ARC domain-containing protein [Micromonospora sp. U21]|uniref:ATP-binding protein n=1 Tax=Micromonospora sp. U21 TaxID=2824899 RepID=UPI001B38F7B1|nr:NB-ARC domain-containing protein [Micromonospora sp. U21]MBQ0905587.1 hypothetical protein [Micromonospora sp. U21]